jgi:hypothetical protein
MTLMPVSNTSVFASSVTKSGAPRWIGQRRASAGIGGAVVDRLTEHVEDATERGRADRHRDRRAGVDDVHAAHDGVGARHGDRAHRVATDVLLHLDRDVDPRAVRRRAGDPQRVVDLGQVLGLELDVENRADDLHDLADVVRGDGGCHDGSDER